MRNYLFILCLKEWKIKLNDMDENRTQDSRNFLFLRL
jgi:hypothetical protein